MSNRKKTQTVKPTHKQLAKARAATKPPAIRWAVEPARYLVENMQVSKNQKFREYLRLTKADA